MSEIEWEDDTEERSALPRETPYEQELGLITPEAILTLQADLLCNSCGIPLVDTRKRRLNEDDATDDEREVYAARRVCKLLAACHGEKWRRQRTSPCYEAIVKAPLPQIAKLALALMRGRGMPLSEAVARAVTHIEAEDYVRLNMVLGGSYEGSIEKFRLSRQAHKDHLEQVARMPKWDWQRDEHGKLLPVELEAGLKALFPLPGYKGQRERSERLTRFSAFLMGVIRDEQPDWGELRLLSEVARRLEEMKCKGIAPALFRAAILWLDDWYRNRVSGQNSEAGKRGQAAKRKNQAGE